MSFEHPAYRLFLTLWDRAAGASDYDKREWRDLSDAVDIRGRRDSEQMIRFFRLRDQAATQPDYVEEDWRELGKALGFKEG